MAGEGPAVDDGSAIADEVATTATVCPGTPLLFAGRSVPDGLRLAPPLATVELLVAHVPVMEPSVGNSASEAAVASLGAGEPQACFLVVALMCGAPTSESNWA